MAMAPSPPTSDYATGSGPDSVAVGDFNLDGKPDLAVANQGSNTVSVLLGNGDGTFAAKVDYATGSIAASVAVGDFNLDGKPDLARRHEPRFEHGERAVGQWRWHLRRQGRLRNGTVPDVGGGGGLQPGRQARPGCGEPHIRTR